MPVFASLSDALNSVTSNYEHLCWFKDGRVGAAAATAPVAGQLTSLWQYNGIPSDGAAPTTVVAPTRTTAGALKQADAGGGRSKYLACLSASCSAAGTIIVYDRLLTIGNLSGTTTGAQTVGGSLTRNTGGSGNQIFAEIYTLVGTTGTTVSASYTNQAGTSSRTTASVTFGGTGFREAQRMLYMPLQSGDSGVQAVASATIAASTLTAGAWGITVTKPLAVIPLGIVGCGSVRDFAAGLPDFPLIEAGACISLIFLANTTTIPQAWVHFDMVER